MRILIPALVVLSGCRAEDSSKETGALETGNSSEDTQVDSVDSDGDGFSTDEDCNDADPAIHPEARELCDLVDNDCDGLYDDDDPDVLDATTWYADADLDGYGGDQFSVESCDAPSGYVANRSDCNDLDAESHPGAEEVCDGVDNDCDGVTDGEDATDALTWYEDGDGDGYGTTASLQTACDPPAGYALHDGDCDDADPAYHPGAAEADCTDSNDYNCDGSVGFDDADGDGFAACEDCDDADGDVNDDAAEICDGADNDCDGWFDDVDPDVTGTSTWYADSDGDGHGGTQFQVSTCVAPTGYVATADDCDDLDANTYPGAAESCDSADNDCDGDVDEGVGGTWYADADSDGYGNGSVSLQSCDAPSGYVANSLDCDDYNAATNPTSYEICDNADNDCDGTADEDAINASTWYVDSDGDGYGTLSGTVAECDQPTGYAGNATDCDDVDSAVNPGATEACDGSDNDCDGSVDEGVTSSFYEDTDSDGYGNPSSAVDGCAAPGGYVSDATDCDDSEATSYPGNPETCDGIDNDCANGVDDGVTTTFYEDADGDGYGNASVTDDACSQPSGYVTDGTDCDDVESASYPGNPETCDGIDNDCANGVDDGVTTAFYEDADNDGYGNATSTTDACAQPSGYVTDATDCNDTELTIYPGAAETCDGVDRNCDGTPGVAGGQTQSCASTSCKAINDAGVSTGDGTYWLDPDSSGAIELYCDMTSDGGGWTYVARGSNGSTQNNSAYGSPPLDPSGVGQWHLSADKIRSLVGNTTPYETYVTMGQNGDAHTPEIGEFRVRQETQEMTFGSHMFEYSGWNGSSWVFRSRTGSSGDRGPSWEPGNANYCCHQDSNGDWTGCRIAPLNQEGQWSNNNTNQHLRCASDSNVHDGLILFVR